MSFSGLSGDVGSGQRATPRLWTFQKNWDPNNAYKTHFFFLQSDLIILWKQIRAWSRFCCRGESVHADTYRNQSFLQFRWSHARKCEEKNACPAVLTARTGESLMFHFMRSCVHSHLGSVVKPTLPPKMKNGQNKMKQKSQMKNFLTDGLFQACEESAVGLQTSNNSSCCNYVNDTNMHQW